MLTRTLLLGLAGCLVIATACGKSDDAPADGGAGQATAGSAGSPGSAGAMAGTGAGAGAGAGGAGAAGSSAGGALPGTSGAALGGDASGEAGSESGAGAGGLVDCDQRKIMCKRAAPVCDPMHVPSVVGTCYGECVKIERCACSGPDECPNENEYTCWSGKHCGPYIK
jgi:hypothetical protein